MFNNKFSCLFRQKYLENYLPQVIFMSSQHPWKVDDMHAKWLFGILYISKYITEDSPYNKSWITSDLNVQ